MRVTERLVSNAAGTKIARLFCLLGLLALPLPMAHGYELSRQTAPDPIAPPRNGGLLDLLAFTPHLAGDAPHSTLPDSTVHDRVDLVKRYTNGIRTFSCYNGAESIRYAKSLGMTTAAGAWMNTDIAQSWAELNCLIALAKEGAVDLAIVGSEGVTWNGLTASQIVYYIEQFRQEVPDVLVTTSVKYEAMILQENQPIIDAVDILYIVFYPFWGGYPIDDALGVIKQEYDDVKAIANGKEVWISETGWPSAGSCSVGLAVPNPENQERYLRDVLDWTTSDGIVLSWFDGFEQPWKNGTEFCGVASHWGLFDSCGRIKPGPARALDVEGEPETPAICPSPAYGVFSRMRQFLDPALIAVSVSGTVAILISTAVVKAPFQFRRQPPGWLQHFCVALLSGATGGLEGGSWTGAVMASIVLLAGFTATASCAGKGRINPQGAMLISLPITGVFLITPWGYFLLQELGFPNWSLIVYIGGTAVALFMAPYRLLVNLAQDSLLTHGRFVRPHAPLPARTSGRKVSVHVPCHVEPPEIVIATLERLAASEYENLEVLVCDNNTEDANLWAPVEVACARLNKELGSEVFRFFHVMGIKGAKAGALNYLLDRTAEDAELVALVDADYQAEPRFPGCLVGYFNDDNMGFVQTAHDYRDKGSSLYKSMCYWEYMPNYKAAMPSANEYDAGFTVGTMCLFRRVALEEAGRWAEWCLTEDSEIAVRLRHAGYEGIYMRDTLGRGLIPERFEDYRKQRFRWTAGPVQQLRRHWRKYFPARLTGVQTQMKPWAQMLELQHSLQEMSVLSTPIGLMLALIFGTLIVIGVLPKVYLPRAAWWSIFIALPSHPIRLWLHYKLSDATNVRQMLGGFVARQSLLLVRITAAAKGLLSKDLTWRRTPKFDCPSGSIRAALSDTLPETLTGLGLAAIAAFSLIFAPALGEQVTGLLTIAFLQTAARFLCAPALALVREIELMASARDSRKETKPANEESIENAFEIADF